MYSVRPLTETDSERVRQAMIGAWGEMVVSRGVVHYPHTLPGFVAVEGDEWLGLLTYHINGDQCEIVTIESFRPSAGVGGALIAAVRERAMKAGCKRLWLITTNDNVNALRFYQKRGFVLVAVHRNAIEESRKIKPQIALIGEHGIPIRDEIELEMIL